MSESASIASTAAWSPSHIARKRFVSSSLIRAFRSWGMGFLCSGISYRNRHRADALDLRDDLVARLDGADTPRRPGEEHIARMQRVEGRREFDQSRNVIDQVARIGFLALRAVDGKADVEVSRVAHLVCRHEPRAQHGIRVDRFAKAGELRPAQGHVESDAVTGDVGKSFRARDVGPEAPNHYREL